MTTLIYSHPACLKHDPEPMPGLGPARIAAIEQVLKGVAFDALQWRSAAPVSRDCLALVHTPDYIADVLSPVPQGMQRRFDAETFAMSGTADAALHAAGLVADAARAVAAGEGRNAFCIASPGGHHAEADTAQGFCFFNHVAMAAAMAQASLGLARIAVVDFDAHHGNGTQSLFWNHADRLLISLHQETGLSGFADETGCADNILNIPLRPFSDGTVLREAFEAIALPKLATFRPDLLLVSAGFDMHRGDPLADINLEVADYGWIGEQLAGFADIWCRGRLVAVLEGGYNLDFLGPCAAAFVTGLMKEQNEQR